MNAKSICAALNAEPLELAEELRVVEFENAQ
jgi:hypothetical protein